MTSATTARIASVLAGVATFAVAGAVIGAWWWAAAVVGALAVIGSWVDVRERGMGYLVVIAALAISVGAIAASAEWLVVVMAVGAIASIELAAAADRTTVIQPTVVVTGHLARTLTGVAILSAAIVVVGELSTDGPSWSAVAAAGAAGLSLRLLAR